MVSAAWILSASARSRVLLRDAGVAVGIAGYADLGDAMALQRAAVDHLDRATKCAGRLVAVARDHQHPPHIGLAARAGEELVERRCGREVAHGEMRHRLEAGSAQQRRGNDCLLARPARHRAEIDAGAGRRDGGDRRDVVRARARRLEREAARECCDAVDGGGALLETGYGGRCGHRPGSSRLVVT
jgi:hypothetical protein